MAANPNNLWSPLALRNRNSRHRDLTAPELADYKRMHRKGPKVFDGVVPFVDPVAFPNVRSAVKTVYNGVDLVSVKTFQGTRNRTAVYVHGFYFETMDSARLYVDQFVLAATNNRVQRLLNHGPGTPNMRTKNSFLARKKQALIMFYNAVGRRGHGTTIAKFQRRGLIRVIIV